MASQSNDLSSQKKKSKTFPSKPRKSKTISSEPKKITTLSHGGVKFQNTTQSKGSETIEETSFTMCSICLDPIVDASDDHDGQDSIYCEGLCDGWIHRRCAGLSVRAFNQLVDPNKKSTSFHCPHCRLLQLSNEVVELKETVSKISSTLENLQQCCTPQPIIPESSVVLPKSDIVTSPYDVHHSPSSVSLNPPKTSSLTIHRPTPKSSTKLFNSSDRMLLCSVFLNVSQAHLGNVGFQTLTTSLIYSLSLLLQFQSHPYVTVVALVNILPVPVLDQFLLISALVMWLWKSYHLGPLLHHIL